MKRMFALGLLAVGAAMVAPTVDQAPALVPLTTLDGNVFYAPVGTCYEDMACWDCETMGNRVCGPDHIYGVTDAEWASEAILTEG